MKRIIKTNHVQYEDSEVVASFLISPQNTVFFGYNFGISLGYLNKIVIKKDNVTDTITNQFHWRYRPFYGFMVWYDEK